jgi:hypothetical protein
MVRITTPVPTQRPFVQLDSMEVSITETIYTTVLNEHCQPSL